MNNDGLTLNQLAERNAALVTEVEKLRAERDRLVTENAYLLNGAARELNTSWMFHKTMLGAQAALACLSLGRESAARDWLEGTTDEAGSEIPDDITVAGLQVWFDSQMVSNDGKSGFLTRKEAEEAIRKACPATDAFLAGIKADAITASLDACSDYLETDCVMDRLDISYEEAETRTSGAIEFHDAMVNFASQMREGADK
ncbi:hypothetical protein V9719_20775 [Klebsiella pneumoniae]|uniref:hypothetical protein n=1 Tax=Klebsiella pneumoniae complex TaxID=3390273 RepID=UPI001D0DB25B|nr:MULTISPECIES: hypothetical protein [Klebsiella]MCM6031657.1 hypothetical protein [Klebsiella pneumoniae]MDF9726808.1 hypothetical protein [Klebsiella pneumoniae]WFL85906.1 hypothetical protein P8T37_16005 [Klebsiella pneumoniae]WFL90929.1 hypothetical protein P8T35_15335 [Klebsiella pneumoniae]WFL98474.1 hypothetical protein P8T49_03025 [Klebsiella pneumoniae]